MEAPKLNDRAGRGAFGPKNMLPRLGAEPESQARGRAGSGSSGSGGEKESTVASTDGAPGKGKGGTNQTNERRRLSVDLDNVCPPRLSADPLRIASRSPGEPSPKKARNFSRHRANQRTFFRCCTPAHTGRPAKSDSVIQFPPPLAHRSTGKPTAESMASSSSSSSSSSAGDSPSLVASWLSSIDLSHAVPNFEMAGIVSPRSLAELELVHYGPLGVTSAEHRKRLFYLVQRVRSELGDDKGDAEGGCGGEGGVGRSTPRNDGRTVEIRHDDNGAGSGTVEVVRLAMDRGGLPATLSSPLSERDHYGGRGAISRVEDGPDGLPHGTDGTCRRDTLDVLGSHRRALSIDVGQDRPHHELPERSPARERLRTELKLRRMRRERRAAEDGGGQRRGPDGAASPAPGNAREESLEEGPTEAAVGSAPAGERGHDELDSILRSPGEVPRARIDPAAAVGGGRRAGGSGGGAGDPAAAADELDSILRSPGDVPRREDGAGRVPLDGAAASAGRGGESKLDSEEEEEEKKKDDDDYDGSTARSSAGDAAHRRATVRRANYASAAPSATASVGDRPGEDERPRAAARRKAGRRRSGIPGGLAAGGSRGPPRGLEDDDDDDDASLSSVTSDLSASVAR